MNLVSEASENPKSQNMILRAHLGHNWSEQKSWHCDHYAGAPCLFPEIWPNPREGQGWGVSYQRMWLSLGFRASNDQCFHVKSTMCVLSCIHSNKHCCSHGCHAAPVSCSDMPGPPLPRAEPLLHLSPQGLKPPQLPLPWSQAGFWCHELQVHPWNMRISREGTQAGFS